MKVDGKQLVDEWSQEVSVETSTLTMVPECHGPGEGDGCLVSTNTY